MYAALKFKTNNELRKHNVIGYYIFKFKYRILKFFEKVAIQYFFNKAYFLFTLPYQKDIWTSIK